VRISPICAGTEVRYFNPIADCRPPVCREPLLPDHVRRWVHEPFARGLLRCFCHPLFCPIEFRGPFRCCCLFPCCGPFDCCCVCGCCGPFDCCGLFCCCGPVCCCGLCCCCSPLECCGPFVCGPFCCCCNCCDAIPCRACPESSVEAILLARAKQGILARMQSFDWQIVHGHRVSSGLFLDAMI
jgi:hypothetical protein